MMLNSVIIRRCIRLWALVLSPVVPAFAQDFPVTIEHRFGTLGDLPVAALARVSLLSIPVAIDALVPMLEAAADGDPQTEVPDARL